jgi:NTE family protein
VPPARFCRFRIAAALRLAISVRDMRVISAILSALALHAAAGICAAQPPRPTVGVAFGGGSARGIAHIGVIQWFEENHIPIDVAAGTSMGGLIGGAFATGMTSAELRTLITTTDWDMMFGSSSFQFKNLRRKEDARSYPSRLEFGLKRGIVPPTALNDGQQVDFLLARITAAYYELKSFDELPTPFRAVAVDLRAGEKVILEGGSLGTALRATMSLPGVFPPVDRDGLVLVDGGALDNVPADVVRALKPGVVIAVDVGAPPTDDVDYSIFGLMGRTVGAMMQASTREALKSADMTLAVEVDGFGSLDWRRADELIDRGYQAAEKKRAELLKYRASDADWQAWVAGRDGRRRKEVPVPSSLQLDGVEAADTAIVERALSRHLNVPIDIPLLERDLTALTGLDRYQSITWQMARTAQGTGLVVRAQQKPYAPPFMMLGLNIENTTSESFRVQLAGRYLAFDVFGSGSELRIDAGLGADPTIGASLYEPFRGTPLFGRIKAVVNRRTFNFVDEDTVIAQYREQRQAVDAELGINLSRESELTGGFEFGHVEDTVRAGDPSLPELSGGETRFQLRWTMDKQDSPVIPSHGTRAVFRMSQTFMSPEAPGAERSNNNLTQAETAASWFHSLSRKNRVFAVFAAGTSFGDTPLPTRQFTAGYPYLLDAFAVGERRGDHYAVLTLGAFREVARLPDFIGGPLSIGGWLQNGSVFNTHQNADVNTQLGLGLVADTLVGPLLIGTSFGFDGDWRVTFGVGRFFK